VVNISVSGRQKTGIDPNDPMFEFFRRFGMPRRRSGYTRARHGFRFHRQQRRTDPDQRTCRRDADEVTVKLTDKREFKAKVVGLDKLTDVAVLRIDARNLPVLRLGDPARARVGEWVVAIGSPFGFENSVTAGIVSAKSRSLASDSYVPFIQTDVAINPGQFGWPAAQSGR
jgi:serine protease Do